MVKGQFLPYSLSLYMYSLCTVPEDLHKSIFNKSILCDQILFYRRFVHDAASHEVEVEVYNSKLLVRAVIDTCA